MVRTLILNLALFDNPEEYEKLEKEAKYDAFDYCLNMEATRFIRRLQAKWILDGDDKQIDSFIKYLNLEKYIVK